MDKDSMEILPDGRMKPEGAAQYTGFDAGTLANWRFKGKGPVFYKRGSRVFYYKADLDAWLQASGACSSTAQAKWNSAV
jgi:hypothetical protein